MENLRRRHPRINNCGEIVVHIGSQSSSWEAEIYHYDNGLLTQVTDNDLGDTFPDINDEGTIVWQRWDEGFSVADLTMLQNGEVTPIAQGDLGSPSVNNLGHIAWSLHTPEPCGLSEYKCDIYFYDSDTDEEVFDDGYSNQSVRINDHDEMTWTRYEFPCGGGVPDWTSEIMFYSNGAATALLSNSDTPQLPDIDNLPRVAWDGSPIGLEVWEEGITTTLVEGNTARPTLNDRGDIAYQLKTPDIPWEAWVYSDGQHYRVSNNRTVVNGGAQVNEQGEIAWWWHGGLSPSGTRFMRRIRNGDVDFDGDRDLDDFIPMPNCWTGPVPTDGLCECRFLDIDHDRDIDHDDFDLFMRFYTGPLEDCNQNEIIDLYDLIDGPSTDCNLNGIPDECDIESSFSQDIDGDGVPDECIAPIPAVSEWGLVALTLLLLAGGSILLTRRRPARA